MDHHHDVSVHLLHRRAVAGLLIAAVAAVLRMDDDAHRQLPRQLDRAIARAVVDQQDLVDPILRDVVERRLQGPLGVVCRQDGDDFLLVQRHGEAARITCAFAGTIPRE